MSNKINLVNQSENIEATQLVEYWNNHILYPDNWPDHFNSSSLPCDVLQGPCACGAYHSLNEWVISIKNNGIENLHH